jgi:hypothetical protein
MKVVICYSDNDLYMTPARDRDPWMSDAGWDLYCKRIVEIPDETWTRYEEFEAETCRWQALMEELDSQAWNQVRDSK